MSDIDQLPGALPDGFAIQVGNAMFRHNITDMVAARHDARPKLEHGCDTRDGRAIAERRCAWQGDDRYAAFRARGAIDKIKLAAHAAIEFGPDAVGTDLTGEVDLDGGVDSNHAFILRDHK